MNVLRRNVAFSTFCALVIVIVIVAALTVSSRWNSRKPPIVDGISAEIFVVHVERSVTTVRAISVAAMRDGAYFATDEQIVLFGLKSACTQVKGGLPSEWSLARLRSLVETPEFQNISTPNLANKSATWYVRARVGRDYKCFGLTESEAAHQAALQPLLVWTKDVSQNHPNEASTYQCTSFPMDFDRFCDVRR